MTATTKTCTRFNLLRGLQVEPAPEPTNRHFDLNFDDFVTLLSNLYQARNSFHLRRSRSSPARYFEYALWRLLENTELNIHFTQQAAHLLNKNMHGFWGRARPRFDRILLGNLAIVRLRPAQSQISPDDLVLPRQRSWNVFSQFEGFAHLIEFDSDPCLTSFGTLN